MKLTQLAAVAALVAGTMACQPAASAAGTTQAQSTGNTVRSATTSDAPAKMSKPRLGPEYKKIDNFVDFRKKLIADGWEPTANPECVDVVFVLNELKHKFCEMVPEIYTAETGRPIDGYYIMHYVKGGLPLRVTVYGDVSDYLTKPIDRQDFVVTGWVYNDSDAAILLQE